MTSPQTFRVAVLPCWKNHGHQHEYNAVLRGFGADFTVLEESRAALDALEGTDCLLIARSNADPFDPEEMKEGCERLQEAIDIGAARGQPMRSGVRGPWRLARWR